MIQITNNVVALPDGVPFDLKHIFNVMYGIALRSWWKRVPTAEAVFNSYYAVYCMHSTTINYDPSDKVSVMSYLTQVIPGWAKEQLRAPRGV